MDVFVQVGGDGLPGDAAVGGAHDAADVDVGVDPVAGAGQAAHGGRSAPGGMPFVPHVEAVEGAHALEAIGGAAIEVGRFRADDDFERIHREEEQAFDGLGDAGVGFGRLPAPEEEETSVFAGGDGGSAPLVDGGDGAVPVDADRLLLFGLEAVDGVFGGDVHGVLRGRNPALRGMPNLPRGTGRVNPTAGRGFQPEDAVC